MAERGRSQQKNADLSVRDWMAARNAQARGEPRRQGARNGRRLDGQAVLDQTLAGARGAQHGSPARTAAAREGCGGPSWGADPRGGAAGVGRARASGRGRSEDAHGRAHNRRRLLTWHHGQTRARGHTWKVSMLLSVSRFIIAIFREVSGAGRGAVAAAG